jgi:hypothetical protein
MIAIPELFPRDKHTSPGAETLPYLTRPMEPDAKERRVRDPRECVEQRFPMSQRLKQACAGTNDESAAAGIFIK